MAFLDLTQELAGVLPGLSPFLAEKHINRALRDIYGERLWSFLVTDGVIVCPAQIDDGTVSFTQYQRTVTLNAAASAALLPQTVVGATPGVLQLQIRFSPSSGGITNQVYSIVDADATVPAAIVLTVDRPIVEATGATTQYQIYRCYVKPPIPDFLKWESIIDPATGLPPLQMDRTATYLDLIDPQRTSQGQAYYIVSAFGARIDDPTTGSVVPNATVDAGTPIYELWPHPTQGQTFYARFRRYGEVFVQPTDVQPMMIEDQLILDRALGWYSYPWAMANVSHYPQFKGVNWGMLQNAARSSYKDSLLEAKRLDDEQALQTVWSRGHGLRRWPGFKGDHPYPIDASFLQSHLVRF